MYLGSVVYLVGLHVYEGESILISLTNYMDSGLISSMLNWLGLFVLEKETHEEKH